MSEHHATIKWRRTSPDFTYESYNRSFEMAFDAGTIVKASASSDYRGDADRVDPEEAFVAAAAGCHMLTFLAIAARKRLLVESYTDEAVGVLSKGESGKLWVSHITLRPRVVFGGKAPTGEELAALHHSAHEHCFIANSVKTEITVEA